MIKPQGAHKKPQYSAKEYAQEIIAGNRSMLGRAITLVESTRSDHRKLAQEILELCMPHTGKSIRIGITGVPGVGKSTFIESFGKYICSQNKKLAVLAIDPSSEQGHGSILGDKTRMEELSREDLAFIRPSPTAGSLGGVARKTRESILLCEAAGYKVILIETVGVGQSETAVHSMVDFFLLLMLAGAGDELQGIKRGIMEMADALVITKADGDNLNKSKAAVGDYKRALHLFPAKPNLWVPKVLTCSSYENKGIDQIWDIIQEYLKHCKSNAYFYEKRKEQAKYWLEESIQDQLSSLFYNNKAVQRELDQLKQDVIEGKTSPFLASTKLIDLFKKS